MGAFFANAGFGIAFDRLHYFGDGVAENLDDFGIAGEGVEKGDRFWGTEIKIITDEASFVVAEGQFFASDRMLIASEGGEFIGGDFAFEAELFGGFAVPNSRGLMLLTIVVLRHQRLGVVFFCAGRIFEGDGSKHDD